MTSYTQLTGKVKWFNNKAGFGFITVCGDGEFASKDIFVHYSSIQVKNSQYKYLVQGEYVDFSLSKPTSGEHEYHAVNVCGIKGGSLMCETRKQNVDSRTVSGSAVDVEETKEVVSREFSSELKKRPTRKSKSTKTASTVSSDKEALPSSEEGFRTVSYRHATVKPEPKTPRKPRAVVSEI